MANISQIKMIEIQPSTSTKWTWKQSEAFKVWYGNYKVNLRGTCVDLTHVPALTSPARAANEECLSRRGGKHCRNSLLSDVTNTLHIFMQFFFIHYFTFFHLFEIFENIWKSGTFMPSTFYRKTPWDKINKGTKTSTDSHELDVIFTWKTTYTILNIFLDQYCLLYNKANQLLYFWPITVINYLVGTSEINK